MKSLVVASFNIHWGARRPKTFEPYDLVAACRALDADVLALQEVWRPDGEASTARQVADELGYELHEVTMGRAVVDPACRLVGDAGAPMGRGDWGLGLLTRVPRGPVAEHHLGGFLFDPIDRILITCQIELDGNPLTICTSHFPHLEHISPLLRWRLRGALPEPHEPAVLMGDFNMWRWVARFILPGWRDAVRGATWPARRPLFQIDHLFATPSVSACETEVVRVGESDHLPIRARVSLQPPRSSSNPPTV